MVMGKPITWRSLLTQNTSLTIENLEPNSGYVFAIRCQTKYGLSMPSSLSDELYTASSASSPAALVPSISKSQFDVEKLLTKVFKIRKQFSFIQIQLLRAKPVNASTIRLLWQTNPPNALSTINGYLIYYREQPYGSYLEHFAFEQPNEQPTDHSHHSSTAYTHHHAHHGAHHSDRHRNGKQHASFRLAVLNDSFLDSALIHDLQPFTTYEFFIIAYHSPYLLSMPSNMALGRTAEALPIRSPSRIYLKVFEATYPPALHSSQQPQSVDFDENTKDAQLYPSSALFSSSMENLDSNTLFKSKSSADLIDDELPLNHKQKRLAVEISWSHVPEFYWRGAQKGYRLDFQLIQSGQSAAAAAGHHLYSRSNSGSFAVHVASNMPQLLHNPANHLHNNTITLNNLTIGASYLLRISACSSAGCGVASPQVPLKMTPRFSYSLLDEPKLITGDEQLLKHSLDGNKVDPMASNKNEMEKAIAPNQETPPNSKKDSPLVTNFGYLDQSIQTVLICSAAIFVFFLLSFLLLLGILFICKNRKLNLKNKTMNINSYIAVAKENCDKLTGQSQQMRLLAPPNNHKKLANGGTLWSDSFHTNVSSNTPISSNTSSARSRIGLPPIPSNGLNASQPHLLINGDSFSTNNRSHCFATLNNQDEQICNGYAELEGVEPSGNVNGSNFNGKNKNQFISQHHQDTLTSQQQVINQATLLGESSTQPYATTSLMAAFSTAFNAERELIQDGGSSDQSIKLSIGTNHLNSSTNSGSQQLQQHFQSNQFKSNGVARTQANGTLSDLDSGSEVYGVSRTSLRKLNGQNGLESCSSIDSLTSNQRIGRARQLIEREEDAGFYHQPYDNQPFNQSYNQQFGQLNGQMNGQTNGQLNASLNGQSYAYQPSVQLNAGKMSQSNVFQPLKPEIMRIATANSINSSHSSNNSPIQTRNRFLGTNNSFRTTTTSFTGSQLIEDRLQSNSKPPTVGLGGRQKSESNLIGSNNKFSIVCNPIDEFRSTFKQNGQFGQMNAMLEADAEYNTFDNQLESKMNKIKKYYQTTKSMNTEQLKSFLNSGQQPGSFRATTNGPEAQSLIYDLVSEEANS